MTREELRKNKEREKKLKELIKQIAKNEQQFQKEEIIHAAGDESLVIPLLIKEYLWRKENGKSTKNVYLSRPSVFGR